MSSPGLNLIPPVSGSQYDAYLRPNSLDNFLLLTCWSAIVGVMTYMSISNFHKYRIYSKDLKNFQLMEEDEKQKELANGGGGTSFMVTVFIWILSIVMSVNVYMSTS